jgi:Arm DNA-binding domain
MKNAAPKLDELKSWHKPYRVAVGGGLAIEVTPSGGKLWLYCYRLAGRLYGVTVGSYPNMSLVEARRRQKACRILITEGRFPRL